MGDLTAIRIGKNDAAFRAANETIVSTAESYGVDDRYPLLCECADPGCTDVILMSAEDYRAVRENPRWFFNARGHQALALQAGAIAVVEEHATHVVVEKLGVAAVIAEETAKVEDPQKIG